MGGTGFLVITVLAVVCTGIIQCESRLDTFKTVDDYMDVCLDGKSHKAQPGKESNLFNLCSQWKDWSCCTEKVSQDLHQNASWYKFRWDHCQELSPKCRAHFQTDLCFYECDTNHGPWLIPDERRWRRERPYKIPLCNDECVHWFEDCKDDLTCVSNWAREFDWSSGTQRCPLAKNGSPAPCRKFSEIYSSAKDFCDNVWDHSWEVVPHNVPCMKLNFNSGETNNYNVARDAAEKIIAETQGDKNKSSEYGVFGRLFMSVVSVLTSLFA